MIQLARANLLKKLDMVKSHEAIKQKFEALESFYKVGLLEVTSCFSYARTFVIIKIRPQHAEGRHLRLHLQQ